MKLVALAATARRGAPYPAMDAARALAGQWRDDGIERRRVGAARRWRLAPGERSRAWKESGRETVKTAIVSSALIM